MVRLNLSLSSKDTSLAEVHPDNNFPYPIPPRYQSIKLLGQGGSGLVYKAYDQRLERTVAIKFARSPSIISRHRLVNEARLLSSVDHPALCRVFDVGEPEVSSSSLFMVLEYIEGRPLSKQRDCLSVYDAVNVVKSLTDGVCRMHEAGYAHNDITAQNIIIRSVGDAEGDCNSSAVLVDLSIAVPSSPTTVKRDIYQLGTLALSLLTDMEPEPFSQLPITQRNRLPSGLSRIIKKALSSDPNEGFQHGRELQQELDSWLRQNQLRKRFLWLGGGSAAILVIVFALFLFLRGQTNQHLLDGYSTEQNQYAHALVFAHYSQHLADDGQLQQATEQAELALAHFNDAVASRPELLKYHSERAHFMLSSDTIFTHSQVTTMLLNAINELGNPDTYEEKAAGHYLRATMYLGLAELNSGQPHLVERWRASALSSAKMAIKHQPDVDRYQQLHDEMNEFQSSAGTD